MTVSRLTQNMRVALTGESLEFSNYLLDIGQGTYNLDKSFGEFATKIPEDNIVNSEQDLIDFVFGDIENNYNNSYWMASRSIICPTNNNVDTINNKILDKIPGEQTCYRSHDSVEENEHQYPLEFINSLCLSGMPSHKLHLKPNSILKLLSNLDPANGHCNGIRYCVKHLHSHTIDAEIICGPHAGKRLFIPAFQLCHPTMFFLSQ